MEKELLDDLIAEASKFGARLWRFNSGMAVMPGGNWVRFGFPGAPDLVGLTKTGKFLAVEAKTKNTKITAAQKNFAKLIQNMGGIHIFAYKVDDLTNVLKNESD